MGINPMSSSKWFQVTMAVAPAILSASVAWAQPKAAARPFTCPAVITVASTTTGPPGWRAEAPAAQAYKFLRINIYNGTPGKEEYDLAPDSQKQDGKRISQTWDLAAYRDSNLFVRCRYEGISATLVSDLLLPLKTCVFTFVNAGGNQPITSPGFACH
jgi:hypothetical protein